MKRNFFIILWLVLASQVTKSQINCDNYPYDVANVSGYPTPRCTLLTPVLCSYAAMVHTDSVDFNAGHIYVPYCVQFGINPLADGRLALCFGRNVPNNMTSSFLSSPTGQVLVFELNLAGSPDMLYVWTYKNGTITNLMSTPALVGLLDLINGYARALQFEFNSGDPGYPGDPNKHRMTFAIDGDERLNMTLDIVAALWGGNTKAKMWITSLAGSIPINSQTAIMFPVSCPTNLPLLKQHEENYSSDPLTHRTRVAPNPCMDGSFLLTTELAGRYRILNMLGEVLLEEHVLLGETRISTAKLAKGTYLLEFRSGRNAEHIKLLVQ